jgi:hypothetical protein
MPEGLWFDLSVKQSSIWLAVLEALLKVRHEQITQQEFYFKAALNSILSQLSTITIPLLPSTPPD